MKTRGRTVTIPPDYSEDENLSDDNEYTLPSKKPLVVEESEDDEDDDDEDVAEIEAIYLDEDFGEDGLVEDVEQPSTSTGIKKKIKKTPNRITKKARYIWTEKSIDFNNQNISFLGCEDLPDEILKLETPMNFFKLLFTTEALDLIYDQSKLYAEQIDPGKANSITRDDITKFIGVIIYMSVVQLPSTRHYWREGTYIEKVASTMTCNKFEEIKRFLHFFDKTKELSRSNENYDKLQKIRPFLDVVRKQLLKIPKEEYLSIDEQMIPTKAKTSGMRQYNSKKPHKWGYLNYVLSGASGFSYDFDIFTGKHRTDLPENCPDLGASGNVVIRLVDTVPKNLNYKLFIDNWYTSLPLMAYLHTNGIPPLGTIQLNRAKDIDLPSTKELLKNSRGYCIEKCTEVNEVELSVTSWVDNKVVSLCSSYVGKEPMDIAKRYSKEQKKKVDVPRPKSVEIYNKYMGGVDLLDSMLGFYRIKIRSKKWYIRIFFHVIDMITVNSWLLQRRRNRQKGNDMYMPLLDFKLYIADVLMRETTGVFTPTTRGRPPLNKNIENIQKIKRRRIELPPREVVEDGLGHWPNWAKDRQRCKNCSQKSYVYCSKCACYFCFNKDRNCFKEFHMVTLG